MIRERKRSVSGGYWVGDVLWQPIGPYKMRIAFALPCLLGLLGMMAVGAALQAAEQALSQEEIANQKKEVAAKVDDNAKLAQVIVDSVFSFAELGFQEFETSKYLTKVLEEKGFTIQTGQSGVPAAWTATWTRGEGGPVIALGSDIDCVPKASQMPGVAWHKPMVEGGPGHGEGHNSGQAVNIVAALAIQDWMEKNDVAGTLMLWPGVAEELLGTKAYFVRDGMFKGVDAVIFTHVGSNYNVSWGRANGTGMISVEYTFHGESAHSAGAPWRGRSALDGVDLMNIGWNLRREHLQPTQRSHFVITNGGDQPNVVPSLASVWYFVREVDAANVLKNFEILNTIAEAAAMMSDTTVEREIVGSAYPRHFNRPMAEAAYANIQAVGLPQWDDKDQAFAKAVQATVGASQSGLPTKVGTISEPSRIPISGGSDDIGEVSWVVPTITLYYPSNIPGLPGHNWSNAMAMATPIAHKGVVAGAKVVAMTVLDLFAEPNLLADAKTYFTEVQKKKDKYTPFISDKDKPTITRNAEKMAEFRPKQKEFYYDADRYDTYLQQLGISWPTLTPPEK